VASVWSRSRSGGLVESPLGAATFPLSEGVALVRGREHAGGVWVLVADARTSVSVNGEVLLTGVRVLETRDEIRCGAAASVFSNERRAVLEVFPGSPHSMPCARCTGEIEPASPGIRCPGCGSWYHQQDGGDFPCWTAVPFCQVCGHTTALGGAEWTPEEF
jgi:hypothetical protein